MTHFANCATPHLKHQLIFARIAPIPVQFGHMQSDGLIFNKYCPVIQQAQFTDGGKGAKRFFSKEQKPTFEGLMMYFWWNIWKERNRRFFQQESKEVVDVTYLIKEDFHLHQAATSLKISCPSHLVVLLWFVFVILQHSGYLLLLVFLDRSSFASSAVVLRSDKASVVLGFEVVCISFIFLLLIKFTVNFLPFP